MERGRYSRLLQNNLPGASLAASEGKRRAISQLVAEGAVGRVRKRKGDTTVHSAAASEFTHRLEACLLPAPQRERNGGGRVGCWDGWVARFKLGEGGRREGLGVDVGGGMRKAS